MDSVIVDPILAGDPDSGAVSWAFHLGDRGMPGRTRYLSPPPPKEE
jgi:hypothetical protein